MTWLVAGLGNPGPRYANNRHNIGFVVADALHRAYGLSPWRARFQAEAADAQIDGARVLLLKPMTFMNESGRAVTDDIGCGICRVAGSGGNGA